jgi:opacity protein-like surface antigen
MKKIVMSILLTFCVMASQAFADGTNNINFLFGQKTLSDDWDVVDGNFTQQPEFGILCDFRGSDWPLSIAVEMIGSGKKVGHLLGSTYEFAVGVKKIWEDPGTPIKPFVGIGMCSVTGKMEVKDDYDYTVISSEKTGMGYFMEGGLYFTVADSINLGALVRYSYASLTVDGDGDNNEDDDINGGGVHTGVFIGFNF